MANLKLFLLGLFLAAGVYSKGAAVETVQRSASATELVKATRASFGIWIDPAKWKRSPHSEDLFKLDFSYTGGDMAGALNAERGVCPLEAFLATAMEHIKAFAPDAKLLTRESRVVSGREVVFLTIEATHRNQGITIYGYYYCGTEGSVQLVSFFPTESAERYKKEALAFLAGLQIGEPGEKQTESPRSNEPPRAAVNPNPYASFQIANIPQMPLLPPLPPSEDVRLTAKRLQAQAENGDARAQCLLALCYVEGRGVEKDFARAHDLMEQSAKSLPDAQAALGSWYATGSVGPRDLEKAETLLLKAAQSGVPVAQANMGTLLFSKDLASAVEWFRKAAEQGNADGEYNLALSYHNGWSVAKDEHEEVKWVQRAVVHGKRDAMELLADCFFVGRGVPQDHKEAARWFREAAQAGSSRAQGNLGVFYWNGDGVFMDKQEAVRCFRKAAEQGDAIAQDRLGKCYVDGLGIDPDIGQAVAWYEKSARQGVAHAQCMTGIAYLQGQGVVKNAGVAIDWLRKAADNGDVLAQSELGIVYQRGVDAPRNMEEALKWLRKATDAGNARAAFLLANSYYHGDGVEKEPATGLSWLKKSAEGGCSEAQLQYGMMLTRDSTDPKNIEAGINWVRKAAEQGFAVAEYQYGWYFLNGVGGPADIKEAVRWFRFSALQGLPLAENNYGYALATGDGGEQNLVEAYKWYILAIGQTTDQEAKQRAEVNMQAILPKLTPEQIEEGKKRAAKFAPIREKKEDPAPFSLFVS